MNVPELWLGICGPFSLRRDGVEVDAPPAAQRAVLGFLALSTGAGAVRPDAIISALWPDDPPATAAAIVHTYVSRLRRLLDVDGAITHDAVGYRLAAGQLDLSEFRRLVGIARTEPDAYLACDHYERAMGLWRGDPLKDVPALRTHPSVTALANERVAVLVEYANRADAIGHHDVVLPRLEELAASLPLDERVHAALMIALAGSGRQAEALWVYEEIRRRLDDELGVRPADDLRYAHQRVLRQDVTSGNAAADWHEVRQLPPAVADFTGRSQERRALAEILTVPGPGVPIAVISGQPGVGKTALALYTAHTISSQFPDGELWVQLAGASAHPRDPGEVLGEMLRVVGVPGPAIPGDHSQRPAALRSALAGRKVLLVVDDAASAGQVASLLPGTPGCAVIVTSRVQLHDLEGATHVPLDVLPTDDAIQVLGALASHHRIEADRPGAAQLAQACGGLPLALRIVGSRLATRPQWPLSAMVRKLTQSESRLRELEAGSLSVRASIESSYVTLPEPARLAFRRIALLGPNDFAGWVVPALLGDPGAGDVLDELVGRSLVAPAGIDATGEPRYRLHDLLRDFAIERLAEDVDPDTDSALGRLHEAWLQLAQRADATLPPEPYFPPPRKAPPAFALAERLAAEITRDAVAWFTAERINLLAATEQAYNRGRPEVARALISCHGCFHYLQDRHDDSELMWRRVAERADDSADGLWAQLRLGSSLVQRGRAADARPVLDGCLAAAVRLEDDDPELLAFGLYWRACSSMDRDLFEAARTDAERGLEVARRHRLRLAEMHNLRKLAAIVAQQGQGESAVALGERSVEIARERFADGYYELAAVQNLAFVANTAGRYERAVEISLRSIEMSQALGSVREEALSYGVLADAYRGLGYHEAAIGALLRVLPVFRAHHAERHTALCLLKLGYAHEGLGLVVEASGYFKQAGELFSEIGIASKTALARQAMDRCLAPSQESLGGVPA